MCKHDFNLWQRWQRQNGMISYGCHCKKCGYWQTQETEIVRYRYKKTNLVSRPAVVSLVTALLVKLGWIRWLPYRN